MAAGVVIAVLLCVGSNCEMVQAEPGVSYPNYEQCAAALATKTQQLDEFVTQQRKGTRRAETVCVHETQTINEVEDPYDVLETSIIHAEPSVNSPYMGVAESGQRTLVTGVVAGTDWLRVLLPDGNTGYLYGTHLRKAGTRPVVLPSTRGAAKELAAGAPAAVSAPPAAAANPVRSPPFQTPAAPASAGRAAEFQDCPTCPVMVQLPGGSFGMGSDADATERPMHRVAVAAFALGKSMVTTMEWEACAADGGCALKPVRGGDASRRQAMTNLSWDDATQYLQWLRKLTGKPYRLPSEAEWEYAERAGTATRYSWGDQPGSGQADCKGCGGPHSARSPADAAAFPANAWGLLGMAGGVAEWVQDCWHAYYQGAPADGAPWEAPNCTQRVLRGGSWMSPPGDITASGRNFYDANVRYPANGVRVALGPR